MAHPQYAVCRLSSSLCLEFRCPLADRLGETWVGCREGWLSWEEMKPPILDAAGKARLNLYLRLHDLPIPDEVRLSALPV
ncbi:MAG: hypothetical protein HY724_05370 [Candidatus Rokubacteria bacterium]|nr:hypothetical protein [Candidatus Rokubacteria bacterium]